MYGWSVALEAESHSEEAVAVTLLESVAPGCGTARAGSTARHRWNGSRRSRAKAIGYDAIDLLSQQIAAGDPSAPWREHRAALLEQVGLAEAAAHDRAAGAQ